MDYFQYSLPLEPPQPLSAQVVLLSNPRFIPLLGAWQTSLRFGFDLETTALTPNAGEIRLLQIAIPQPHNPPSTLVVDLGWQAGERQEIHRQLTAMGFWDILAERLFNPQVEVVGHSLDFEQQWLLAKYNLLLRCVRDTKLMSQVYWAGLDPWLDKVSNHPHSLASVGLRLGISLDKTQQTSNWGWGERGDGKLSHAQLNYAATDAQVVLEVYQRLQPRLQELGVWQTYLAECSATPAFAQMSHSGIPVNEQVLEAVTQQYESAYHDLLAQLQVRFAEAIPQLYSSKALAKLINARFQLKLQKVNADVLSQYWDIAELRLISVIKTTKTYLDYLHNLQAAWYEGYVRGNYTQINRKAFGRSSASEPNLQNPPNPANFPIELRAYNLPPIRSVFVPHPGTSLIVCDLSKAHTRIACEASGDAELTRRLNSPNQEIFCSLVATIAQIQQLGSEWTETQIRDWLKNKSHPHYVQAKLLRAVAKTVHYGCLNLQGYKTLQKSVRTGAGITLSDHDAKTSQQGWKQTYARLAQFQQQIIQQANQSLPPVLGIEGITAKTKFGLGYVRCLTQRGVFLPKYPPSYRQSGGLSVKGPDATAAYWTMAEADIVKIALGLCVEVFDRHPHWQAHIGNMAHDEVDVVASAEFAVEVATAVQAIMVRAMRLFIQQIPVDEGESPESLICESWAQK